MTVLHPSPKTGCDPGRPKGSDSPSETRRLLTDQKTGSTTSPTSLHPAKSAPPWRATLSRPASEKRTHLHRGRTIQVEGEPVRMSRPAHQQRRPVPASESGSRRDVRLVLRQPEERPRVQSACAYKARYPDRSRMFGSLVEDSSVVAGCRRLGLGTQAGPCDNPHDRCPRRAGLRGGQWSPSRTPGLPHASNVPAPE